MGIAGLVVRIHADDAPAGIVGKGQVERGNRREAVAHAPRDELVARVEAIDRPEGHVTVQPQDVAAVPRRIPEDTRSAPHHGVRSELVGEAEPRRKGLRERLDARRLAHAVAAGDQNRCRLRIEAGPLIRLLAERSVELVPQPDVQGQLRRRPPVVGDVGAVLGAANGDVGQEVVLLDQARRAEQERGHHVPARVAGRVVGDVGREVEAAVAAVGLELAHVPAAHVEAGFDRVLVADIGQVGHVLEGALVPQDRQRAAMADARIARRAEDREAVLLVLLVGVGHAELLAELIAGGDVGLREIEVEAVVSGARIQDQARREHVHPADHGVLRGERRGSREGVLVAEADGLR